MNPSWKIVEGNLLTRWSKDVDPAKPLPEYPRPQLVRENWVNLNGLWDYAIRSKTVESVDAYDGKILVPFCVESALSGVKIKLKPSQRLFYRRTFMVSKGWSKKIILLHFGAVDWKAMVWINDQEIGSHEGGYVPFTVDITDAIDYNGENKLILKIFDPTDKGKQQFGKQVLHPSFTDYTRVSGIWQTVWLEPVPETYISSLHITPDVDNSQVFVMVEVENVSDEGAITIDFIDQKKVIASGNGAPNENLVISIENPALWSLENPHLYDMVVTLSNEGKEIDRVQSYLGMRKISLEKDTNGVPRIALNGEILFQYGPLDQGYWPDGLYTAPTDDALKSDIELTKKLGFNMIRKHVKVEPDRWYYHCDRMGLLVWQDMPNYTHFLARNLQVIPLGMKKVLGWGRKKGEYKNIYHDELGEMVKALYNHPCIVAWVPFNEGWGQFETGSAVDLIRELDTSRLIDAASGWVDEGLGDVIDEHTYPSPNLPHEDGKRALVIGEFGGLGLKIKYHYWKSRFTFPFVWKLVRNKDQLRESYAKYLEKLKELIQDGLSAAVYTQLTDVEKEFNGFITYDRELVKLEIEEVKKLHDGLFKVNMG